MQMWRQGDGRQGPGGGAGGWLFGELPPLEVLCASRVVSESHRQRKGVLPPSIGALSSELPPGPRAPPAAASLCGEQPPSAFRSGSRVCSAITTVPAGGPGSRSRARVPGPESRGGGRWLAGLALHPASRVTCPPCRRDPSSPLTPPTPGNPRGCPAQPCPPLPRVPAEPLAAPGTSPAACFSCIPFLSLPAPPHLLPPLSPPSGALIPF